MPAVPSPKTPARTCRTAGTVPGQCCPSVLNVNFKDTRGEVILHTLEQDGICVSTGSACSSNHPAISGTLKAIGVENALLDSTLRFSFSYETTEEEIRLAAEALKELVPVLGRYQRS